MEFPTENIKNLAEFIIKVYSLMWFYIKMNSFCTSGSKYLSKTIQFCRYLPENLKKFIDPVSQRNMYFG
jgi:hypothetical protein